MPYKGSDGETSSEVEDDQQKEMKEDQSQIDDEALMDREQIW